MWRRVCACGEPTLYVRPGRSNAARPLHGHQIETGKTATWHSTEVDRQLERRLLEFRLEQALELPAEGVRIAFGAFGAVPLEGGTVCLR